MNNCIFDFQVAIKRIRKRKCDRYISAVSWQNFTQYLILYWFGHMYGCIVEFQKAKSSHLNLYVNLTHVQAEENHFDGEI